MGIIIGVIVAIIALTILYFVVAFGIDNAITQHKENYIKENEDYVHSVESKRTPNLPVDFYQIPLLLHPDSAKRYFGTDGTAESYGINLITHKESGTVHFGQSNEFLPKFYDADFELIDIDYDPLYKEQTTTTTSGRGGQALVGGLVAGPVGAVIGASGKRTTTYQTTSKELKSWGTLTLRLINTGMYYGKQFRIHVKMDSDIYEQLMDYFLWDNIDHVYDLKSMPIKA